MLSITMKKVDYKILVFIALLVLLLDQVTKSLVYKFIPAMGQFSYAYPYGGLGVFKNFAGIEFSIVHMTNKGAAWGVLGGYQLPLIILRMGLIVGIIVHLAVFNQKQSWQIPLTLILAGAIGNVIDFFTYGHVVDMLHFVLWGYDFPVFNVADSAITIGICYLLALSWLKP